MLNKYDEGFKDGVDAALEIVSYTAPELWEMKFKILMEGFEKEEKSADSI